MTFLPALMALIGRRGYAPGRTAGVLSWAVRRARSLRRGRSVPAGTVTPGFWQRWTDRVTRRPIVTAAASVLVRFAASGFDLDRPIRLLGVRVVLEEPTR